MVFIDAENVSKSLFNGFYQKHPEEHYKVYGKLGHFSDTYLKCKYVDFIHCCSTKNSADTFMVADIVKSIYENHIYDYYIMTHDKDLAIAIKMLTDKKKHVILVSCIDGEMKNLQEVGVDFEYLDYEQYAKGMKYFQFLRIPITAETKHICFNYPNTAWIKLGKDKILEMPFKSGMPITTVKKFLAPYREAFGVGSIRSWADVLTNSYIKVIDDKAYYYSEEELYAL
jgi:hypothetical protein